MPNLTPSKPFYFSWWCLFLLVSFTVFQSESRADPHRFSSEELIALLHAAIDDVQSIHFKAKIRYYPEGGNPASNKNFSRGVFAIDQAGRWRADEVAVRIDDESRELVSRREVWVNIGELSYIYEEESRQGGIRPAQPPDFDAFQLMQWGLGWRAARASRNLGLHELLEHGGEVSRVEDDERGRPRLKLSIPAGSGIYENDRYVGAEVVVTLAPEHGFLPSRIQVHDLYLEYINFEMIVIEWERHNGISIPKIIETRYWSLPRPEAGSEEYDALDKAMMDRGVDREGERSGRIKANYADPKRIEAVRAAYRAVYGAKIPVKLDEYGVRRMEVLEVIGLNDAVQESVFGHPFPDGVRVYDAIRHRQLRVAAGVLREATTGEEVDSSADEVERVR